MTNKEVRKYFDGMDIKVHLLWQTTTAQAPFDEKPIGTRNVYYLKFSHDDGTSLSIKFYDSVANYNDGKKPTYASIIECMQWEDVESDMWDFAETYGYEICDKKTYNYVKKVHRACQTQHRKIKEFFEDDFDTVVNFAMEVMGL